MNLSCALVNVYNKISARETYAVQAFLRGDSAFNLTISNLNDSFDINLFTNHYVYYGLGGSSGTQLKLAQEYLPISGNLENSIFPLPDSDTTFLDLTFNGSMWVGIIQNLQFTSGIIYKKLNDEWRLALGNPFPLDLFSYTNRGIKSAFNGLYWLAIGFSPNNVGFINTTRSGNIWRSNDGITWSSITTQSMGFRVAATDLKWNGSYWLIIGSDYTTDFFTPAPNRTNYVLKYDGLNLSQYTSVGLNPDFDGLSIEWNNDAEEWVLMGGPNSYFNIVNRSGISVSSVFTKRETDAAWTSVALPSPISTAKLLRYNNSRFVVTTDNSEVYISTDNTPLTLTTNPISMSTTTSIVYLKSNNIWLLGGHYSGAPALYKIENNVPSQINVTNTSGTIINSIGSTDIDGSLWSPARASSQYMPSQVVPVQLQHGPQSPQGFLNNLQDGIGQSSLVNVDFMEYDSSNPALIHVGYLRWYIQTSDPYLSEIPFTYVEFASKNGGPINDTTAATFGLYENGLTKTGYILDQTEDPYYQNQGIFDSPSPVILSQPVTWTFRKLGVAGLADTDGSFSLTSGSYNLVLGPGQNEFYAADHFVTFTGSFVGPNHFATLSGLFRIITSENLAFGPFGPDTPVTYINKIDSVQLTILYQENTSAPLESLQPANVNGTTWTIDNSDLWLTATFDNLTVEDTGQDFIIAFTMTGQLGEFLGSFQFQTTYYSEQKFTQRISPLFEQLGSEAVITSTGAGGGTFVAPNFEEFSGGNSVAVTQTLDLSQGGIYSVYANVGARGQPFLSNGSTGGQSTRVSINATVLCDAGAGGGGSQGAVGGSAGLDSLVSPTPVPPGEDNIHGGEPFVFGFVTSSQNKIYNLRPGGTGGQGSRKVNGEIEATMRSGTGTQSNILNFFGAGAAGRTGYLDFSDGFLVTTSSNRPVEATDPETLCQTTNIIQEIFDDSLALTILNDVMPKFAANPVFDNEVSLGTSVGLLNVGIPEPTNIGVRSFLSLGPSDEFLPFTQCPNCRPIDDYTNDTAPILVLNQLCIYDDGQIIYSKIKDYIGTVFYAPGFNTYVTALRVGSSETAGGPNNRYNCIYLTFQDILPNFTGPFYWDIPGGFLNGNIVQCDGLLKGLRASVPFQNDEVLSKIYGAIENLYIPSFDQPSGPAEPIRPTRVLPGTGSYAALLWPSTNLRVDLYARETNGPNSIVNGHFEEFEYRSETNSFTVPIWCSSLRIMTYGAAASSSSQFKGSHGSLVIGTFRFSAGTTLYFQIGLGGGAEPGPFSGGSGASGPLGGGSTGVFTDSYCLNCIQGAAGGGAGSTNKAGISELDSSWSVFDGRIGQSANGFVGESSNDGGPGGSGFPGGSAGRRGYAGAGGLSLVPPNGSLRIGLPGTAQGLEAPSGKIIFELF